MENDAATEPTTWARHQAFNILTRHGDVLRDDVSMNELIDDIAARLDDARISGRNDQRNTINDK